MKVLVVEPPTHDTRGEKRDRIFICPIYMHIAIINQSQFFNKLIDDFSA